MFNLFQRKPKSAGQYRIVRRLGGYEPQYSYSAGVAPGLFWFPINEHGYWLEPEAFSSGNVTKHVTMTKDKARKALLRARAINAQHITAA